MREFAFSTFVQDWFPSIALIIFLSIFMTMIIYVSRKTTGVVYKDIEQLPFDEGSRNE